MPKKNICLKHGSDYMFLRKDTNSMRCSKCASEKVIMYRKRNKKKLVDFFGGKCMRCGYDKSVNALQFHHLNPSEKKFGISFGGCSFSFKKLLEEAKKCILLCANCHAEVEEEKVDSLLSTVN